MVPLDVTKKLAVDGYAVINAYLPEIASITALSSIGEIVRLPGVDEVQVLAPRQKEDAPPNTYSGNFGIQSFPLHTDLAHWFLPPRYFALRCVVGSNQVSTHLIDVKDLIPATGRTSLTRTLVRPRRPLKRHLPLLRLLTQNKDGSEIFRWDNLFVVPATSESEAVCRNVSNCLSLLKPTEVYLENPGDTLIIDNWRMIHGRSEVSTSAEVRRIERAYFGEVY